MGTRADFYVGRGEKAEWLGSIAWDGDPAGIAKEILRAKSEKAFRALVHVFLKSRDDATFPKDGWPWPWIDSNTTDYAYAFDNERVWACDFGEGWFIAIDDKRAIVNEKVEFPNMKAIMNVDYGKRSGIIIVKL